MKFPEPSRTSHSHSHSRDVRNAPSLPAGRPSGNSPAPLVSRCASCGGGRRK